MSMTWPSSIANRWWVFRSRNSASTDSAAAEIFAAQIDHLEHRSAGPGHRLLSSVRKEPGAQHRMRRDEIGHRPFQPLRIYCPAVEFDVEVGRDTAEFLFVGSADPIRVLHGGQRERLLVGDQDRDGARPGPAAAAVASDCSALSNSYQDSTVGLAASSAKVMPAPRLRQPPASAIMRIELSPNWMRSSWSATSAAAQPSWAEIVCLISSLLILSPPGTIEDPF